MHGTRRLSCLFALAGLLCISWPALRSETTPIQIDVPILTAGFGAGFFEDTARQFEQLRPGVRVAIAGDPRIHEKVRIRVIAGQYPDATDAVLLYDTLIASGKIRDLGPYLDGPNWEGDGRWGDSFLPGVLDRWKREGGHVYGVPFAYGVWTIFYDRALFAKHGWEPPRTWDQFFALCEAMRAAGIPPLSFPGVYMRYGDAFLRAAHYNLVGPEGFRAYNELQPGTRSDPRFVRAAEVTQRITTRYLLSGWEGMTHTAAQQAFLEHRAAMTASAWLVSEMRDMIPKDFALGAFNLPVFSDGVTDPATIQAQAGYYFLFETGDPARERATIDFFRFLTSRERAKAFARHLQAPVALRAVGPGDYASPAMKDIAVMMQRAPATFDSAPPASAPFMALFNQGMTDARYRLFTGRITAQQFGDELERAAANEVARAKDPNRVATKHRGKATLFAAVLLSAFGGLLVRSLTKRLRRPDSGEGPPRRGAQAASGADPRLRFGLAAGFVGPAFVLFGAFVILPSLTAFVWAFYHWDGFTPRAWAGWFNFKWLLLESDAFWFALKNNLYVMIVPTLAVVPLSLFLATLIHRGIWGARFFRAVFLFPNLLGGIAATLLWMNAYDPHGGLVNTTLVQLGNWTGIGWLQSFRNFAWLSQANLYHALIPIYLWMACGFNLILYLAAMEGINPELYEAAEIDGASPLRQFFTITVPLIWDVLVTSAVFIVIAGLNTFEMIWLLTSQDPVSGSHVLSTLMVSTMFREFQVGRATAIAVVMFLLVLMGSVVVLRGMRRDTRAD
ncbi:ABC transporter substrate-binding protein [Opitutaceae bacterium EW11]|nr:ABC transporter substrate-binding protein [Opitutaceae bacterium EW11]